MDREKSTFDVLLLPGAHILTATSASGEGSVVEIDFGANKLLLDHDPIPALQWPRMVMEFAVAPGVLPKSLKLDDRVRFEMQSGKSGEYVVDRLDIVAPKASSAPAAAPAPHKH